MKKNSITLSQQELQEIIANSVKKILEEGIKINRTEKENFVTFDDSNDALIDGPVKGKFKLPNSNLVINTYSMFKRVGNIKGASDANPLLFSLKGKNKWTLTNPEEFWKRFGDLVGMFIQDHPLEKIVMIPSTHGVNSKFAQTIKEISPDTQIYDGFLTKLSVGEIARIADEPDSFFRKYWWKKGGENELNEAYIKLEDYLSTMKDGVFSYSDIPDMEFRKSIINTLKLTDLGKRYCNEINGKHILLLDDSIAAGQTVESAINALKTCYEPASISLITIFSQKYRK